MLQSPMSVGWGFKVFFWVSSYRVCMIVFFLHLGFQIWGFRDLTFNCFLGTPFWNPHRVQIRKSNKLYCYVFLGGCHSLWFDRIISFLSAIWVVPLSCPKLFALHFMWVVGVTNFIMRFRVQSSLVSGFWLWVFFLPELYPSGRSFPCRISKA